jgi:hypothetical protein
MATNLMTLPLSDVKMTGYKQFGDRAVLLFADHRPVVVQPGPDGEMKAYLAGIKPPTVAPTMATGAASVNFKGKTKAWGAYCFYSRHRTVFSQLSPVASVEIEDQKVAFSNFQAPREDADDQDISHIVVALGYEDMTEGQRTLMDLMAIEVTDGTWTSKTLTLDIDPAFLELGFRMDAMSLFNMIPPASMYVEKHGDRLWYAGAREQVALTGEGVSMTLANVTFRGATVCRLRLTGAEWDDSHLCMAAYGDGAFLGHVWDVDSTQDVYLDRAAPADLLTGEGSPTAGIVLKGIRDALYPSALHVFNRGHASFYCPETTNVLFPVRIPALTDKVQVVSGLSQTIGGLIIQMNETAVFMSEGFDAAIPKPAFVKIPDSEGSGSLRGGVSNEHGDVAWVSPNGLMVAKGGSVQNASFEIGCSRLFKGAELVTVASLADAVLTYVRDFDGFIVGNVSIGVAPVTESGESPAPTANYWVLFTRRPQVGFWLMSHCEMTSNLIEYADDEKRSCILVGDGQNGRVKRLMAPGTLTRMAAGSDAAEAFQFLYRGGWEAGRNAKFRKAVSVRLNGAVVPGLTYSLIRHFWRENFPQRNPSDVAEANKSEITVTQQSRLHEITNPPGDSLYASVGFQGASTTGSSSGRPIELVRWEMAYEEETKK